MDTEQEGAFILKVPIAKEPNPGHFRDLVIEFERMAKLVASRVDQPKILDVQAGEQRTLYVFVRSPRDANQAHSYTFTRNGCVMTDPEQETVRMDWMEACSHCMEAVQRALDELAEHHEQRVEQVRTTSRNLSAKAVEPVRRVSVPPPKGGS